MRVSVTGGRSMFAVTNWMRALLAAVALAVFAPAALATDTRRAIDAADGHPPSGSPEFGILIVIGIVGFLVLVAWLFSRVGDDGPPSDRSMI